MNKKIYLAPRAQAYEIKTEGVIAESLKIYTEGGGDEQLSNQKEMDDCLFRRVLEVAIAQDIPNRLDGAAPDSGAALFLWLGAAIILIGRFVSSTFTLHQSLLVGKNSLPLQRVLAGQR